MRAAWLAVLTMAMQTAVTAPARAADVPSGLRTWLMALESVPTAAQLQQAGGRDVADVLDRVVHDPGERSYGRHRALSFLGILADGHATELLRRDLRRSDAALRATAAVAWAAGPGRRDAKMAVVELDRVLQDHEPGVRAAAARGLAFLADRQLARDHAMRQRERETHPDVRKALDRTLRQLDERAK